MSPLAKKSKFWALGGIFSFLLCNYPLLEMVNHDTLVWGVPVLVLYLQGVWLAAIAALFALGRRLTPRK